jgi:hypothetical protein
VTSATPSAAPPSSRDQDATDALQRALGTEHAALWVAQLVTAFLPADLRPPLAEATTAHRARRDAVERLLRDRGAAPVAPEPAYSAPATVTDPASALALLVTAESDVAAAWRFAVERTDDAAVRTLAMDALVDAAVRATRWRRAAGVAPPTVPFPGAPS